MFLAYWSSKPGNLEAFFARTGLPTANTPTLTQKTLTVGSSQFKVEVAQTEQARKTGLSGRESLPEDSGMLFVLEKKDEQPAFWMKGMKFPIDIIWINDNVVSEITSNVPTIPDNTPDPQIPKYAPRAKVDYVLEIPAGVANKRGIKVGDTITLPQL
ncbi:MAG: hypothetical protein A2700_00355 [Candidatus Blackburnbacteria bacterium RIFCSPHIGHO2_01_FULL_44_64]|nr:MAG: hypothetical protein A2700_00355 [Candidatus Blackburnbacteria bacterium RIFCSPHIGHO2_01_FULL_44_64]OGY13546.1 MAG: hypothetical protein A3A62_01020 [Candidatus Blackburnbacteria bacterium RIFCSPLOWO2_01_FULL_44_43]